MLQTRSQLAMTRAWQDVTAVADKPEETRKIYGGLCHQFPVLVRSCGLCQALAFSADKGTKVGTRGDAHQTLLAHVQGILIAQGLFTGGQDALAAVRGMTMAQYVRATQVLLDHWIFYKRFAVSILKVDTVDAAKGD